MQKASRLAMSHLFFFNDTATTEIYTLSLHDALPIYTSGTLEHHIHDLLAVDTLHDRLAHSLVLERSIAEVRLDRKSTRLNSSHANISYAVFCLKKKQIFSHTDAYIILYS